jgi:hypothetical protein
MKFVVKTLVDISETRARFNPSDPQWLSQQNYITTLNTIGLRANPIILSGPVEGVEDVEATNLGSSFKGMHKVWTFEFALEQELSTDIEALRQDFNGIPFIDGLGESVTFKQNIFATVSDIFRNISFEIRH